ncbi:LOW QUALITY PROTEIN: hypothetical protein T265_14937 [Opisthorchis viverrini]|uniref:Peptidase A1 domain-containing protein n=1 Tax=Opisthorchis viverrini TaxID=6198 RepID=A0A074Z987_OPIVI|nr:LOW QUALITY PROTEIN: hypothetical protein T265_14937 [Opisthorchis viverrini]KER22137.1 LOW QUALITY PROTEIN: hypothetical protein T265_14937 [Opisthorchis viverrini]
MIIGLHRNARVHLMQHIQLERTTSSRWIETDCSKDKVTKLVQGRKPFAAKFFIRKHQIGKYKLFGQESERPGFYVVVGFGKPRQNFRLLIDTGSSTLWVPSDKCEPGLFVNNNKFKGTSKTFQKKAGALCEIYGDGSSIEGTLGTDTLDVRSYEGTELIFVPSDQWHKGGRCDVWSGASRERPTFTQCDGNLGLAVNETAESFDQTLLEYLFTQELISQLVFTIVYPRIGQPGSIPALVLPSGETAARHRKSVTAASTLIHGKITFGGVNHDDYRGEISYATVLPGKFWRVQFHRRPACLSSHLSICLSVHLPIYLSVCPPIYCLSVSCLSLRLSYSSSVSLSVYYISVCLMEVSGNTVAHNFIAIADTGTYLVMCPYGTLLNLISQLGVYLEPEEQVDCEEADEFPEIIFTLDGFQLGFPRDLYVERKLTTRTPLTSVGSHSLQPLQPGTVRTTRSPPWKASSTDSTQAFCDPLHTPLPSQGLAISLFTPL